MNKCKKCLLCKHKNLSLIPKTIKLPGMVVHAYNPTIGEVETKS